MNPLRFPHSARIALFAAAAFFFFAIPATAIAAGGKLTIRVDDETTGQPASARLEIFRGDESGRRMSIRRTVPAGVGVVIDRTLDVSFPDGPYTFRLTRGPEYRVIRGNFILEPESLDEHGVRLPRIIDMLEKGWTSGDCCVLASPNSLPLRMASEDLHVAAVLGHEDAKPIAGRDRDDPPANDPSWIREDAVHDRGLLFYGLPTEDDEQAENDEQAELAGGSDTKFPVVARLASLPRNNENRNGIQDGGDLENDGTAEVRVAIENPFAWPLPVWLASQRIDGFFVLGDWLRLDRKVLNPAEGRAPEGPRTEHPTELGRWAERIYSNLLEAGFRIPPLAGSGSDGRTTPVGYNRLYVAAPLEAYRQLDAGSETAARVASEAEWWHRAFRGNSVATNGPMLLPTLSGQIPGFVFTASSGQKLTLQPEIQLSVRDPVDYLEVIHNGEVFYSARLDEFAKAGGVIPALEVEESGWVMIRVVTLYEDHYRAAMSAPWYIEFDRQSRVTSRSVDFFRDWLSQYEARLKKLPPQELSPHIPYIRAARAFWTARAEEAVRSEE
ncbi:putative secreted protein [Rhodopirellula maiorica SM1]|uniref:Putative secreted protein n=1 Tax=Rhodopirellula maiorica SM1 TaxID=1265738 RepID=M5S4X8_9BACT|nr:hypothetical protein [Rhodopirellula maiorica]EMI22697.1 putative secreted protein [Rhodopirellula maiorica SM1]